MIDTACSHPESEIVIIEDEYTVVHWCALCGSIRDNNLGLHRDGDYGLEVPEGTYWSLLWDSLRATDLAFATIISGLAGILLWAVARDTPILAWVAVPAGIVLMFVLAVHADALRVAARKLAFGSFRVKHARGTHPDFPDCDCICLIETAVAIPLYTQVSLYFNEKGYDYELGIGVVRRHQEEGTAIVAVHKKQTNDETVADFLHRLQRGEGDAITALRVSPTVTRLTLPETKEEAIASSDTTAGAGEVEDDSSNAPSSSRGR